MHKQRGRWSRKTVILVGIALIIVCYLAWFILRLNILHTNDEMSLTYSRSATPYPSEEEQWFYVKDNELYFVEERGGENIIRHIKDNIIRTFAKLPNHYDRFIILDDGSIIIEQSFYLEGRNSIFMLDTSDGTLVELWQGKLAGYHGDLVYFTNESALYAAEVGEQEPLEVISFDELLAFYHDGIVYKKDSCIYQILLEQPTEPQLLTANTIEWPDDVKCSLLLDVTYLYTSKYALCAGIRTLDMYVYETGEMRRIYEADTEKCVVMAITANENELYVSRQLTDFKLWPKTNIMINGTYKYDIQSNKWTKITNKAYSDISQFDERYLYGKHPYSFFSGLGIGQHAVN